MIQFKVQATPILGDRHRKVRMFARSLPGQTWAHCGDLTMTAYECDAFKAGFSYHEWEDAP